MIVRRGASIRRAGGLVVPVALSIGAWLVVACSASIHSVVSTAPPGDSAESTVEPGPSASSPDLVSSARTAPSAPREPMNVLLITVDSLRAEMPWTDYARPIAPRLTELARQSVRYTHAYSVSSVTAKSLGGMLASRYPSEMSRSYDYFTRYFSDNLMFPEVLHDAGIRTAAAHAHWSLRADWGYGEGFDTWSSLPDLHHGRDADAQISSHLLTPLAIETLRDTAKKAADRPFFAWVHYMDPHQNYRGHADAPHWGNRPKDMYDAEVWYTDLWVGRLLDWVDAQPWGKKTAILVTADHGEIFDEHHMGGHGFELWEALIRVPFLAKIPGVAPVVVDTPRSMIDLGPTILALLGVPTPPSFRGVSLVPEMTGGAAPARLVICDLPEDNQATRRRAVLDGSLKYMIAGRTRQPRLFDVAVDPGEHDDLRQKRPDDFRRLEQIAASLEDVKARH